jgi:hypothetical protein
MAGSPIKRARRAAAEAARKEAEARGIPLPQGMQAKGLAAKLRKDVKAAGEPIDYEAWDRSLTDVEKVVETICEFMMNGQWLGGASVMQLAREFKLGPETVRRYAAEANRLLRSRLRQDPELADGARYEVLQNFRIIRAMAMKQQDAAGLGVALNANRALGFYLGVEPVKRLDVADVSDEMDSWSDTELEDFAKSGRRPRRALRAVGHQLVSGELGNGANGHANANGNGHADADEDDDDEARH